MIDIKTLEDLQKQFEEFECKAREKEEPETDIHTFKLGYLHLLDTLKDCQDNIQSKLNLNQCGELYKRLYEGQISVYNYLVRTDIKLQEKINSMG